MHFLTNAGSKIVYKVGEIPGARQAKFNAEMIAKIISLNKMTKKNQVTFDPGDENYFKVHIGDKTVKFPSNDEGIYISKSHKIF